jgi:hypothetical protein
MGRATGKQAGTGSGLRNRFDALILDSHAGCFYSDHLLIDFLPDLTYPIGNCSAQRTPSGGEICINPVKSPPTGRFGLRRPPVGYTY